MQEGATKLLTLLATVILLQAMQLPAEAGKKKRDRYRASPTLAEKRGPTGAPVKYLDTGGLRVDFLEYSPDGKELAFAANIDETGVDDNFDIFVVPVIGGKPRNLSAENPGDDDAPLYSPDGRHIAYVRQVIKGFYADKLRLMLYDRARSDCRSDLRAWRCAAGTKGIPRSTAKTRVRPGCRVP